MLDKTTYTGRILRMIYHTIWLSSHTNRTPEWLEMALANGFQIHHADGNHDNNDPSNLVLIERSDHLNLHNNKGLGRKVNGEWVTEAELSRIKLRKVAIGQSAYDIRKVEGLAWAKIGTRLGYEPRKAASVATTARAYANYHNLEWPLPHKTECMCIACRNIRKA